MSLSNSGMHYKKDIEGFAEWVSGERNTCGSRRLKQVGKGICNIIVGYLNMLHGEF